LTNICVIILITDNEVASVKEELQSIQKLIDTLIEFSVSYSFQIVGAIIILIGGVIVGKWLGRLVGRICERQKMDITLAKFIASLTKTIIIIFATIIALSKFGITIAPFIAAIGAAAFGATYAIQGPLSNYGAGLAIIIGRSFKVGDTINVAKVHGIVEEIRLAHTTLITEDGIKIVIPNKHIVGEILENSFDYRIVEQEVGISYSVDPEFAVKVIRETLENNPKITNEPVPQVGIEKFDESSINIGYRFWVKTDSFVSMTYSVNMDVYKALKANNITIPFPQREIKIIKES